MADGNTGNQTSFLNTTTLSEMTDLVRRNWIYTQKHIARNARQLFIVERVGSGQGNSKRYSEVDIETYADHKAEGTDSTKSRVGIGYSLEMTARTFSKEIDITIEMRDDNRYMEVGTLITNLSEFCINRQDLDLTHRLTFANATSYTDKNGETVNTEVGDGLALGSASHTLAFSSTTYSNIVSGAPAFSQGSYEAALLIAATQIYTNFGEKRNMNFNSIISGDDPGTVREIRQLLESTADIDAQHAGVTNVYQGTKKHVILPNLATTASGVYDSAKRRWWSIAAIGQGLNGWQAYLGEWIKPTMVAPGQDGYTGKDIHNYNWTYSTYCRYGICIPSPKGIIFSFVSS